MPDGLKLGFAMHHVLSYMVKMHRNDGFMLNDASKNSCPNLKIIIQPNVCLLATAAQLVVLVDVGVNEKQTAT